MDKTTLSALEKIIEYLKDEEKDFRNSEAEDRENHIWPEIELVKSYAEERRAFLGLPNE